MCCTKRERLGGLFYLPGIDRTTPACCGHAYDVIYVKTEVVGPCTIKFRIVAAHRYIAQQRFRQLRDDTTATSVVNREGKLALNLKGAGPLKRKNVKSTTQIL
eukprot:3649750-Pyramimonas_sp.AAC.1